MDTIGIFLWGLGTVGVELAKLALNKEGVKILGIVDEDKNKIGKDLGDILSIEKTNIIISDPKENLIDKVEADVVILSTKSQIKSIFTVVKDILKSKKNCITIAEEMVYPYCVEPELSIKIDELAKENNVTILGTGVNPGFILDSLIITLSSTCNKIRKITAERINDLSDFGLESMKFQGVGTTLEEFEKGIDDGEIVGHIGFLQSISMIVDTLGIDYDEVIESKEPIISNTYRTANGIEVEPGMVAGCNHVAIAYKNGKEIVVLEMVNQIYPQSEAIDTGDYINIYCENDLHFSIKSGIQGIKGSALLALNMIPQVVASESGLKTMVDMKNPHAIENNFMDQLKYYKKL